MCVPASGAPRTGLQDWRGSIPGCEDGRGQVDAKAGKDPPTGAGTGKAPPQYGCWQPHLAVTGNGLLIFVDDVLGTQAALGTPDLSTGVCIDAIGSEGAWDRKRRNSGSCACVRGQHRTRGQRGGQSSIPGIWGSQHLSIIRTGSRSCN